MGDVVQFIRDRYRGFSEADAESLREKLRSDEAKRLDGIIEVTPGELRALTSGYIAPPCDCA
jgi:hypothetical protein